MTSGSTPCKRVSTSALLKVNSFPPTVNFILSSSMQDLSTYYTPPPVLQPFYLHTMASAHEKAINALTVRERGDAEIRDHIKLRETRPFVVKEQGYVVSKKSVFNRTIGDSRLELEFASFLEDCADVESYAKNYFAVGFKLDYVKADGDISNYYPDFIVRRAAGEIWIVETKGREDLNDPGKWERLQQWCSDASRLDSEIGR